ncbi:GNAT family N-acetyltransferase [Comamonas sp. MYb69]|uniref:GNAT family N-acetyltransferase n=1 Tax=Comamonas sp. MYb69 TaxID=1848650 RepID=UPI00309B4481
MHLSFAPVAASDFEALFALRVAAMRPSLERLGIFNLDHARKRFERQFAPQYMRHICVDEGAGPQRAGLLTVVPYEDGRLKLQHLYLLPAWHNRRIGDWAMQQVQNQARREGRAVWLEVLNQSDAIRFYERHGFVQTGGDPIDLLYQWTPA